MSVRHRACRLDASCCLCLISRKRREYFAAGVRLAWFVDPVARTVTVYTAVDQSTLLHVAHTLDGGAVLPGFALPLQELFDELDRQGSD